jgi:hypothetical protein
MVMVGYTIGVSNRRDEGMRFCIADPPYLGRAVRWYGEGGCGNSKGEGQADNHPEAHLWDEAETHIKLVRELQQEFDGWAIAMSVHSLSTYLSEIETDSRNGIRVAVWHKPSAFPSGSRIANNWEPVLIKVPKSRRGRVEGLASISDVMSCPPLRSNFVGAKPQEWTHWVLSMIGYQDGDEVIDYFVGSGAVSRALNNNKLF